jgi:hypothetical protein
MSATLVCHSRSALAPPMSVCTQPGCRLTQMAGRPDQRDILEHRVQRRLGRAVQPAAGAVRRPMEPMRDDTTASLAPLVAPAHRPVAAAGASPPARWCASRCRIRRSWWVPAGRCCAGRRRRPPATPGETARRRSARPGRHSRRRWPRPASGVRRPARPGGPAPASSRAVATTRSPVGQALPGQLEADAARRAEIRMFIAMPPAGGAQPAADAQRGGAAADAQRLPRRA